MKKLMNLEVMFASVMLTVCALSLVMMISAQGAHAATGSSVEQMNQDYKLCIEELEIQYINSETDELYVEDDISQDDYSEMQLECEEETLM